MFEKPKIDANEPISEPIQQAMLSKLLKFKLKYSIPKLYIPKTNGRTCLKKRWYVSFYYDHPETDKRTPNCKFTFYHGINTYKKAAERREFGNRLVEGYTGLLERGWNPWENRLVMDEYSDFEVQKVNIIEAIKIALKGKERTLKPTSYEDLRWRIRRFIRFAKERKFDKISSKEFTRMHIVRFLEYRSDQGENATSINNYRASLSTILTDMVQNGHLDTNFVRDIPKLRTTPVRNHPFTEKQIIDIKKFLLKEDPQLLDYIRVLAYSFLRNNEVATLLVGDVDLRYKQITATDTKSKAIDKVYIIDPLLEIFNRMQLQGYPNNFSIFTPTGEPAEWNSTPGSKSNFFSKRFRKVKEHFGFGAEYGIYSFRHSFAVHLLDTFMKRGMAYNEAVNKMLPITRHESVQALENYLREKKNMLPKDYTLDIEGIGL